MGLLSLVYLATISWGNVLVVEYKDSKQWEHHGGSVEHIACHNEAYDCELFYTELFDETFMKEMEARLDNVSAMNMSLGFQEPELVTHGPPDRGGVDREANYQKNLQEFKTQKENLHSLILDYPDVLFTIAAGNGFFIGNIGTGAGVPLSSMYPTYPAILQAPNRLAVAASGPDGLLEHYSNYSLWEVDVAAPVEENHEGEILEGTSFAAPYVAKLVARLKTSYGTLESLEIKEILMKSSKVRNPGVAVKLSEAYLAEGKASLVFQTHVEYEAVKRIEMIAKLGDVLLIKSGGVVNDRAAKTCAEIYVQAFGVVSVEDACLEAQKTVFGLGEEELTEIKKMWSLRGF